MTYTLSYLKSENKFIGYLLEIPGMVTQSNSLEELKENIKDALGAMLEVLKEEELHKPNLPKWRKSILLDIEL